jgi:hypothetical protein
MTIIFDGWIVDKNRRIECGVLVDLNGAENKTFPLYLLKL